MLTRVTFAVSCTIRGSGGRFCSPPLFVVGIVIWLMYMHGYVHIGLEAGALYKWQSHGFLVTSFILMCYLPFSRLFSSVLSMHWSAKVHHRNNLFLLAKIPTNVLSIQFNTKEKCGTLKCYAQKINRTPGAIKICHCINLKPYVMSALNVPTEFNSGHCFFKYWLLTLISSDYKIFWILSKRTTNINGHQTDINKKPSLHQSSIRRCILR